MTEAEFRRDHAAWQRKADAIGARIRACRSMPAMLQLEADLANAYARQAALRIQYALERGTDPHPTPRPPQRSGTRIIRPR